MSQRLVGASAQRLGVCRQADLQALIILLLDSCVILRSMERKAHDLQWSMV